MAYFFEACFSADDHPWLFFFILSVEQRNLILARRWYLGGLRLLHLSFIGETRDGTGIGPRSVWEMH